MTVTLPLPFRSSRWLARGNALLGEPCVALDVVGIEMGPDLYASWRRRVEQVARELEWPPPEFSPRHPSRAFTLGFTVPANQLHTAREANEWALCASVVERDPLHWSAVRDSLRAAVAMAAASDPGRRCVAAEIDERKALQRLAQLGVAEARIGTPA